MLVQTLVKRLRAISDAVEIHDGAAFLAPDFVGRYLAGIDKARDEFLDLPRLVALGLAQ